MTDSDITAGHVRTIMRRTGALIIAAVLVLTIPAIIGEESDAAVMDPCTLHFDFQPGGQSWIPARCGMVPDPDSIAVEVGMGTWHLENGDPWDPTAPLPEYIPGGVLELIIDERPEPPSPPAPDPPAPTPPTPEPTPEPEPKAEDKTTKYALISVGAGAVVAAVLVLGYFAMRRH